MLSLNNAINMLSITSLKPKQEKILELLSQSTDFFVTLPTGYGKSVAFQLAPFCLEDDEGMYAASPSYTNTFLN